MSKVVTREEALQKAAQKLDISPSKYKQAMERFDSVKSYLLEGEYKGASGQPEIYLQGSFKLGTEIRPYRDSKDSDYDIDIVCRLEHDKENTTAETVKHQVGDHLKANGTYEKMLDNEGKRCWTLNYAEQDGIGFHMDILPAVQESWNTSSEYYWFRNAISATNKCSVTGTYEWTTSNPRDFSEWFYDKNKSAFEGVRQDQKQALFEAYRQDGLFNDRDSVPDIHVKTPLQRAIQLLKRHRDIRFSQQQNEEYKPISMIITVLAAQIYNNETTIYETLQNLLDTLSRHANQMQPTFRFDETEAKSVYNLITRTPDGKWHIANPTNHGENFADKWHEDDHARAKAFFQWVAWAKEDFINIAEQIGKDHFISRIATADTKINLVPFAPHAQLPAWPINLGYSVQITAKYKSNATWHRFSSGEPLEKHCDLLFNAQTNAPAPFQVFWQVVNTGKEAEYASQLRGQILPSKTAGTGGVIQKEYTSYIGTHWVECFIVKNGACVARSGEFLVRII